MHADYRDLDAMLDRHQVTAIDGVLADLGVSSLQLDGEGRGFSFQRDEPLDMRMDTSSGDTAADLVASASERDLADAIFTYGEERFSRRIARAIVHARNTEPIATTGRLASIVRRAVPTRGYCASIRRRAPFRRSASGSIASSMGSIDSWSRRSAGCAKARGWSSSAFTRSRIAS